MDKQVGTKDNSDRAFTSVYEQSFKDIYKTALYYSKNAHAAEEVTQRVFMLLYTNRDNINWDKVRAWLLVTTKHMALNYIRDIKREIPQEEVSFDRQEAVTLDETITSKMCDEEYRHLAEKILKDLYEYNPRWYYAITVCYYLEKPQKEVAGIMGVSLEVLHSMLYRAKNWIKKNYINEFNKINESD